MDLQLKEYPTRRYACILHKGPYNEIGASFDKIFKWAASKNIPPHAVGIYYDNPETTDPQDLRAHAGIQIPTNYKVEESDLEIVEVPAGQFVVYSHFGPYEGLPKAWKEFMAAIEKSNFNPTWKWDMELYMNDCDEVPPEQVHTDLCCSL